MSGYVLITLNMIEYADVYLKKQSAEYARIIMNVSDAVQSIRSLNLLSSYRHKLIQNTVKHLRQSILQKHNQDLSFQNQETFFSLVVLYECG